MSMSLDGFIAGRVGHADTPAKENEAICDDPDPLILATSRQVPAAL
jgi:hypothetical protein